MAEAEVRTWWIVKRFPDGRKCRVQLRRGTSRDGTLIASYSGYMDFSRNTVALYREEFAYGCPGKTVIGLYDCRWAVPSAPAKSKEPEKVSPEKVVRHRLPDCPGQIAIDFQ